MATQSLEFKSGLDDSKFQAGLKNMEKGAKSSTGKISGMMKGIGIAAVAAAAIKGARMVDDFTGAIEDNAAAAQMDTQAFQGLAGAFELGGVNLESFARAAITLNSSLESARTEAGLARDAFDKLGISFSSIANSTPDEMIYQLSDALKGAKDKGAAFNAVQDLIGKKQAMMIAAMKMGGNELKKQADAVEKVSEAELKSVGAVADKITMLIKAGKAKLAKGAAAVVSTVAGTEKIPRKPFDGEDPRRIAAEKKALELRKESLRVLIQTTEEAHKASQESVAAAREALMTALSGQRATRPTSKERSISRMMERLESPMQRKTGLQTGGLGGRRFGETIMGSLLAAGKLSDQYRSLSARSGAGKAVSEFAKAKEMEKQNAANLAASTELLKSIEKGINGE